MSSKHPRLKEIEEQLAHLKWRKMQNERLVRVSLEATRSMAQRDSMLKVADDRVTQRISWLQSVVQDELTRPLVIDDLEMDRIQAEEGVAKDKAYMRQIRHMEASNKIEKTLEKRLPKSSKTSVIPDRFSAEYANVDDFSLSSGSRAPGPGTGPTVPVASTEELKGSRRQSSKQRIETTKVKLNKIKEIKGHINSHIKHIEESKPIVNAKWQPALPT